MRRRQDGIEGSGVDGFRLTNRAHETDERCADGIQVFLEIRDVRVRKVPEPPRGMHAVRNFRQRGFGDVQEMQALAPMAAAITFRDVCGDRICRPANLRTELKSFDRRKRGERQFVDLDEQIIGSNAVVPRLPR
jgi:hypothetical protein